MDRRTVLGSLAALFATASFPFAETFRHAGGYGAATRIGRIYLSKVPNEADADLLRELIGVVPFARESGDWKAHFDHLKREDFSKADTIIVDGWLLARCEARFCALLTFA